MSDEEPFLSFEGEHWSWWLALAIQQRGFDEAIRLYGVRGTHVFEGDMIYADFSKEG